MLQTIRNNWKQVIENELQEMGLDHVVELNPQKPPKSELGDIAFALFAVAKELKKSPVQLVLELRERLEKRSDLPPGSLITAGPYLNVRVAVAPLAEEVIAAITSEAERYGHNNRLEGEKVMVEFSCPNTNKPLHLGHLRNDAIGESISAILAANGAEVQKVNLINNRGIHICKSMLAYQKFGHGETPESSGTKGDHLVGSYYVRFAQWEKEDPTALDEAQTMLKAWEEGNEDVRDLWQAMNQWTLDGLNETYAKTNVSFDKLYFESDTYLLGRSEVLAGLEQGVFYRQEDGSIWVDLSEIKLDQKVLLRKDGTSLYLTQDIGTAIERSKDWPFDQLIYVVANEQRYHFTVLFYVLEKLGYEWAKNLHHLSYGMVNLPDGKMKSREGTVVDADELLSLLASMASDEIKSKEREQEIENLEQTSSDIALGALNYFLLQVNPLKDMVFNPADSLSFNGNTGPYLQYMGARICSMLRKSQSEGLSVDDLAFDGSLLVLEEERSLVKLLADFSEVVAQAAIQLDPSLLTAYLYELSRLFSKYYHDHPILRAGERKLVKARLSLSLAVLQVLRNAFALLGIPFLEIM